MCVVVLCYDPVSVAGCFARSGFSVVIHKIFVGKSNPCYPLKAMEIRDLRLANDAKIICTFKIYINELHLTLLACLKRGKKEGSEFVTPFSKGFEGPNIGETIWCNHWEFDKDQHARLIPKVKDLLKIEMNKTTQDNIPL